MAKIMLYIKDHIIEIIVTSCIIFLFILMAILIGAGIKNESNRIAEGEVIDKDYTAAYVTHRYSKVGDRNILYSDYHPESYRLKIKGRKGDEIVEYWFECTAEEYQQHKIGDYYRK